MRRIVLAAALAAAALLPVGASAAAGVRITGVDASAYPDVRVTVVAPPGSGRPTLLEDGHPVAGASAANLARARSVVVEVDRSQSMAGAKLADATAAAEAFVAAKDPSDRIEVITFGRRAVTLTHFSSSTTDAGAALQQLVVDPVQGTALWDAVVLAARGLEHELEPGHVIVVLTDGADESSSATLQEAIDAAHAARAAVYAIGITGRGFTPGPLRRLAAETGGAFLEATSTSELKALYASIGNALAGTWQIDYATAERPGDTLHLTASVAGVGSGERSVPLSASDVVQPVDTPPSSVLPRSAWAAKSTQVVVAAIVGFLTLLACGFLLTVRSGSWLSARLAPHLGPAQARGKARGRKGKRNALRGLFAATEKAFSSFNQFRALQSLLTRADLPLLAAELLYICVGSGLLVGLLGAAAGLQPLLVLAFMAVGGALPVLWVRFKARSRMKAFDNQLPDLLITIAASLKAGHSFRHAIQAVVDEGAEPAAKEFRLVLTETRLGRPMDDALAEMSERIGSKNLTFVLNAVTIQRQIGGSLAGLFDMVAETVRQRQQFARKIRGLTAMGRMSAYVLVGLPFVMAAAISLINPTYMGALWHTSAGHDLVALGFTMMTIGSLILKKIVSFRG